jgi:hypothetical protein
MVSWRRLDSLWARLSILGAALCMLGAAASLFVVLVRVPALAVTKLELLFGTLLGVAVGHLFAIAGLLLALISLLRRSSALPPARPVNCGSERASAGSGA